jgi:hypothetical protein
MAPLQMIRVHFPKDDGSLKNDRCATQGNDPIKHVAHKKAGTIRMASVLAWIIY